MPCKVDKSRTDIKYQNQKNQHVHLSSLISVYGVFKTVCLSVLPTKSCADLKFLSQLRQGGFTKKKYDTKIASSRAFKCYKMTLNCLVGINLLIWTP